MTVSGGGRERGISLPSVLNCISRPAIIIRDDYRIVAANNAYRNEFFGGEPVCGRFCYEVSHHYSAPCDLIGESCPIQRCRQSGEPCRDLHLHFTSKGQEHQYVTTYPIPDEKGEVNTYLEIIRPPRATRSEAENEELVGQSPVFNQMLGMLERVGPSDASVLLLGESGTGKELAAKTIHRLSRRSQKAFVPLDCSGLSESLFESELFGHEKGAFTGASKVRIGLAEAADEGTLFLDEVGDIPLALQVKLLRLLESGVYRRVGGTAQRRTAFRLICATNCDLSQMVGDGSFRRDLYYRISAFPVPLPPLREHPEDIPLLIESLRLRPGLKRIRRFHPKAIQALKVYSFPGNVRELLNILQRAALMADGDTILHEHLPRECRADDVPIEGPRLRPDKLLPLAEMERQYLQWAVASFRGDNRQLACRLGLSERTLYRKLQQARSRERQPASPQSTSTADSVEVSSRFSESKHH